MVKELTVNPLNGAYPRTAVGFGGDFFLSLEILEQYGQYELIPVLELAKAGYQAKDKVNVFLDFGFHAPRA